MSRNNNKGFFHNKGWDIDVDPGIKFNINRPGPEHMRNNNFQSNATPPFRYSQQPLEHMPNSSYSSNQQPTYSGVPHPNYSGNYLPTYSGMLSMSPNQQTQFSGHGASNQMSILTQSASMPRPVPPPPPTLSKVEDQTTKRDAMKDEIIRQKSALSAQRDEYNRKAKLLMNKLHKLKDLRMELHSDKRRSPSPDTKVDLKNNSKLQMETEKELKAVYEVVSTLNGIIGDESVDSHDSNDLTGRSSGKTRDKDDRHKSPDDDRWSRRSKGKGDRRKSPDDDRRSRSKKDEEKRRSRSRDRSPTRTDKDLLLEIQRKLRTKDKGDRHKSPDSGRRSRTKKDEEKRRSRSRDRSPIRTDKDLLLELQTMLRSKKDEEEKPVRDRLDLLMELQGKLSQRREFKSREERDHRRENTAENSRQSRSDANKSSSTEMAKMLLKVSDILTTKGERSWQESESSDRDKLEVPSSDEDEFRLKDVPYKGHESSKSEGKEKYPWLYNSRNNNEGLSPSRKRYIIEADANVGEKRFRHDIGESSGQSGDNKEGQNSSNVMLDKILSALTNVKGSDSLKLPFNENVLPEFDPMSNNQTVLTWIINIEKASAIYGWTERELIQHSLSKLVGVARTWYESLPFTLSTWAEWKKTLIESFTYCDDYAQLLTEMLAKRVKVGESLEEYCKEKLMLLNKCKIFKKYAVDCILHGIDDSAIKVGAQACGFSEPSQVIEYLKKVKVTVKQYATENTNNTSTKVKRCFRCREYGHVISGCNKPAKNTTNENNAKSSENNDKPKNIICFNCNTVDHYSYNCPSPTNQCTICDKLGHLSVYCKRDKINQISPMTHDLKKNFDKQIDNQLKYKIKRGQNVVQCSYCHKLKHKEENCFKKQRHMKMFEFGKGKAFCTPAIVNKNKSHDENYDINNCEIAEFDISNKSDDKNDAQVKLGQNDVSNTKNENLIPKSSVTEEEFFDEIEKQATNLAVTNMSIGKIKEAVKTCVIDYLCEEDERQTDEGNDKNEHFAVIREGSNGKIEIPSSNLTSAADAFSSVDKDDTCVTAGVDDGIIKIKSRNVSPRTDESIDNRGELDTDESNNKIEISSDNRAPATDRGELATDESNNKIEISSDNRAPATDRGELATDESSNKIEISSDNLASATNREELATDESNNKIKISSDNLAPVTNRGELATDESNNKIEILPETLAPAANRGELAADESNDKIEITSDNLATATNRGELATDESSNKIKISFDNLAPATNRGELATDESSNKIEISSDNLAPATNKGELDTDESNNNIEI